MLNDFQSRQVQKVKKLAAKGEFGLTIATLWLATIIIGSKIWKMIKLPVWRVSVCAVLCVIFILDTSYAPVIAEKHDHDESVYDEIVIEEELTSEEYVKTEVTGDDDTASLDDLIATTDEVVITEDETVDEPSFDKNDWKLVLVNKQHPIPDDYTFTLGTIKGSMRCDERILKPLTDMFTAASMDGINLIVCSPYRDMSRQEYLFDRKMKMYINSGYSYIDAYKEASTVVTVPGASEHQIGISLDIICDTYSQLDEGFADTDAGRWLMNNSYKYGFILRYPSDKEDITGIIYEPWHYRYVGVEAATVIYEDGLCLEEFVGDL